MIVTLLPMVLLSTVLFPMVQAIIKVLMLIQIMDQ